MTERAEAAQVRIDNVITKTPFRAWVALVLLILLAMITATYWSGLDGGFTFDDNLNILSNPALHVNGLALHDWIAAAFSSPVSDLQRPLAMLSFAVNHYFTGLDPWPMKLTNLAIHLLNTLLVFFLARSVIAMASPSGERSALVAEWAALFTAACWALHPINLMAVLYVVQRMESLCHTFVFAGLWMYVAGRRRQLAGRGGWGLVLTGLIAGTSLGVLAKESAALLPLYALCIELCVFHFRRHDGRRDKYLYGLYVGVLFLPALLGLAWLLPRVTSPDAYAARDFSLGQRLLTEPRVVLDYLHWTLLPDLGKLSLYHDDYAASRSLLDPPTTLLGVLAIPMLLAIAWFCRRQRPLTSLGLLWFIGAQLLTATIIPLELVFEHRNYFASLGICLALADLLLLAPGSEIRRRAGGFLAVLFLLFCTGITHLRASEWSNPVRFAWSEAAKHPQSPRATITIARVMMTMSGYKPDSPFVMDTWKLLEHARNTPHAGILPVQATLVYAARIGAPIQPAWWQQMQTELRDKPIGPQEISALTTLTNCAVEGLCNFPPEDMLETFDAALSKGSSAQVLNIYAIYSLLVLNDNELALRLWKECSALAPNIPQYRISLAELLIELGRIDAAEVQIAQLRQLGWLGQNDASADVLEKKLRAAVEASKHPAGPTAQH